MKLQQLVEQVIADSQITPLAEAQINRLLWSPDLDGTDLAALEKLMHLMDSKTFSTSPETATKQRNQERLTDINQGDRLEQLMNFLLESPPTPADQLEFC